MKTEIKNIIKERIKTNERNLKIFNIVRAHVKKYEGKKYTRRYLPDLTTAITKEFGSTIFKYGQASLDQEYSWKSIKLNLDLNNGYSYSYQLHYDSQELVTMEEFDRLNQCWSLDKDRTEKLRNLLKDNATISRLSSSMKAINKAHEALEEMFQHGEDADEVRYDLVKLMNVKLERK